MIDLRRVDDREHLLLASYAMHSRDTAGRVRPETAHDYRGPFARDRDRVLHSSAFRRLSGKMQVFTGEMGEYHRTRLTHTFEVASVARTIARTLRLNEDLTESLALVHDIGHPPFGHCGEDVLAEALKAHGGFSHNQFAITIVTELEQRYTDFPGLNLSREVLSGQDTRAHKAAAAIGRSPLLEVQVVDLADSIAYNAHDVDDALQMGVIDFERLSQLSLVARASEQVRRRYGTLPSSRRRQALVHELVDLQITDLLGSATDLLRAVDGQTADEVRASGLRLRHTPPIAEERVELERYLFDAVYRHPRLMAVRQAASTRLRQLLEGLIAQPDRLPLRFRTRAAVVGIPRSVGDYLAGMTDRFCDAQYHYFMTYPVGPLTDW
ncbi:MAG: dGTP triphosphohydrolase [Planctomycetaceae bacterium]